MVCRCRYFCALPDFCLPTRHQACVLGVDTHSSRNRDNEEEPADLADGPKKVNHDAFSTRPLLHRQIFWGVTDLQIWKFPRIYIDPDRASELPGIDE